MAVDLAELKRWMRKSADATAEDQDLEEVLQAAIGVVVHRTSGVPLDEPLRVYANSRGLLILPAAPIEGIGELTDPAGNTVGLDDIDDVDLGAGIVHLGHRYCVVTTRGPWLVTLTTSEGEPAVDVATKIIAEHLWGLRRGSGDTGARARAQARGADGPIVPVGYAVPNRAAELLAPFATPLGFA